MCHSKSSKQSLINAWSQFYQPTMEYCGFSKSCPSILNCAPFSFCQESRQNRVCSVKSKMYQIFSKVEYQSLEIIALRQAMSRHVASCHISPNVNPLKLSWIQIVIRITPITNQLFLALFQTYSENL